MQKGVHTGHSIVIGHGICRVCGYVTDIKKHHDERGTGEGIDGQGVEVKEYESERCFKCALAERWGGKPLDMSSPSSLVNFLIEKGEIK